MRAFVTGDEGFIAGHVVTALDAAGHTFHGCDTKSGTPIQSLDHIDADVVIHLAAIASARHPDDAEMWLENLGATAHVLSIFDGPVVFASTCVANIPLSTAYAGSKWAAENLVLAHGGTALRFSNVYGPGQREAGHEPNVLAAWAKSHREGKPLRIDGLGNQTRDFIHVSDVARAVVLAAEKQPGGVMDVCTGVQTAVGVVASRLYPDDEKYHHPRHPGDPDCVPQDPEPAAKALGFRAEVTL